MNQSDWIINLAELAAENDAVSVVFARTADGDIEPVSCIPKSEAELLPEDTTAVVQQARAALMTEAQARGLWPLPLLPPA
ncbi:hypothetical protein WDZ92_24265 [Nostoc sp. NIES-2111]